MRNSRAFIVVIEVMLVWRVLATSKLIAFQASRSARKTTQIRQYSRNYHLRPSLYLTGSGDGNIYGRHLERSTYQNSATTTFSCNHQYTADRTTKFYTTALHYSTQTSEEFTGHSSYSLILDGLNPSQVEAVTQPTVSISRVVAGPGSGKTRVLTCRIAYLLEHDRHSRILAVTFTRKAAGEMQQRVEEILRRQQQLEQNDSAPRSSTIQNADGNNDVIEELERSMPRGLERVTLGTFHSICAKIMRWNGKLLATLPLVRRDMENKVDSINLDGGFTIIDQSDQLRLVKKCLDNAKIDLNKCQLKPIQVINGIARIKAEYAQNRDPLKQQKGNIGKATLVAAKIYKAYRESLFSNNSVDFDDLIFMTRELLVEYNEVRGQVQRRWPHVLVDEFQDTSRSQMDLVKLLTTNSLFVVGDADQSIYSWRGAHVGSMSDFATDFQDYPGGVQTVHLKENYRSTSNIIKAAEKVIMSHSAGAQDESRKSMKPTRESGPKPRIVACADEKAEASFVVDTILEMIASGKIGQYETSSVIYRTNAQSRHFEEACVQKNLPFVIRGNARSFYERAEIKDCLCFLRWLQNGYDQNSMFRAMKTPSRGIGEVAMREFKDYCEELDSFYQKNFPAQNKLTPLQVLLSLTDRKSHIISHETPDPSSFISNRAMSKFTDFSLQMRGIYEQAYKLPVHSLLAFIITELGLKTHFDSISKSKSEFEDRWDNVQELCQAAKRYEKDGFALRDNPDFNNESGLENFLDDVSLVVDIAEKDAESSSKEKRHVVNLMTVHGSKGTEYDLVFVVGNEDGNFPTFQALKDGDGSEALEEEKRLCYVAITRAKTQLLMTWRKEVTRWGSGGLQKTSSNDRSRFLDILVGKNLPPSQRSKPSERRRTAKPDTDSDDRLRRSARNQNIRSKSFRATTSSPQRSVIASSKRRDTNHKMKQNYQRPSSWKQNQYSQENSARRASTFLKRKIGKPDGKPDRSRVSRHPSLASETLSMRNARKHMVRQAGDGPQRNERRVPNKQIMNDSKHSMTKMACDTIDKKSSESKKSVNSVVDSTWFFPVGSRVIHSNFGRGIVLQPPRSSNSQELLVRVEFDGGREKVFPASGKDLLPDLGD